MNMKPNLTQIMKQAQKMQEMLKQAQEDLKKITVVGQAGGDLVKLTMRGDLEAQKIELSTELKGEAREVVEDLITAAINDAIRKVQKEQQSKMGNMTSNLGLPEGLGDI